MRSAFNVVMRIINTVVAALMVVLGSIWILQGLNLAWGPMRRGFMMNDKHWALYGAILALAGVCQIIWSNTRQANR